MEKLNRSKGALKGAITKLEKFVQENTEESTCSSTELEIKLRKLPELQTKMSEIRDKYYDIPEIKDLPEIEKELDDLESRTEKIEVSLNIFLKNLKVSETNLHADSRGFNNIKVKLPEIPLPIFNGKYEEWSIFKVQFTNLIIHNEQLNDAQKLFYLRASLKNEAKQLESADDSFDSLFTALTERFENHRLLIDTHLSAIINYEKIHHESSKELRSFIDCVNKNLRALKVLEYEQNNLSDAILINIILQKVDKETRKLFEYSVKKTEYPQFAELMSFLENRSCTLESVNRHSASKPLNKNIPPFHKTKNFMLNSSEKSKVKICDLCKLSAHNLNKCSQFLKMNTSERYEFVKQHRLCVNCLNKNHIVNSCISKYNCHTCGLRHNSLLHREKENKSKNEITTESSSPRFTSPTSSVKSESISINNDDSLKALNSFSADTEKRSILLSTCFVFMEDNLGKRRRFRVILDSASNVNILVKECADALNLKKRVINVPVSGLNGSTHNIKNKISSVISNADETFKENIDFLIVPKITDVIPSTQLNVSDINLPNFVQLADPTFFKPGKIHALIGAELFYRILKHTSVKVNDKLFLQDSVFGWIPTGALEEKVSLSNFSMCYFVRDFDQINDNLKQFWELESIGIKHDDPKLTETDQAQQIFDKTVTFTGDRYEVQLPWKSDRKELNDNFNIAKQRLEGLKRKFYRNPELYRQYSEIIEDYLNRGIIEQVDENEPVLNKAVYYLPHHAVCKEDKLTTKVRIVFDASSHDNNMLSLNDCLWPGPNLNPFLFDILIHFRLNEIAFSSDIEKAFLQISLAEKDRDAVRFLWYDNDFGSLEKFKIFRFKRVLFGVNASPFLLSATIKEHIKKFDNLYPRTVHLLDKYIYVDDFISGEDTLQEALDVSLNAKKIMSKAGMTLRKWITNNEDLIKCWQKEGFDIQAEHATVSLGSNLTKVLGMSWKTEEDCLTFEIKSLIEFLSSKKSSKRLLLQAVGKIFDPLGILTPFTIRIKCLFQELWLKKTPWDGQLPTNVQEKWLKWCEELPNLAEVKIQRKILSCSNQLTDVELHAFSDASKSAYGSAVYLRVRGETGVETNLVTSKSRVAPIKEITLPRLELLGALLSARLTAKIKPILDQKVTATTYYWTDSKITLYWIKGSPRRWKQFVANRVMEINALTNSDSWYHCSSKDNPADILTRGASVNSLLNNSMWFKGPNFLAADDLLIENETITVPETDYLPETKSKYRNDISDSNSNISLSLFRNPENVDFFLNISNNYLHLLRILAYIHRFIYNCKSDYADRHRGSLTTPEIKGAETCLIRLVQGLEFKEELRSLKRESGVPPSSKIKCLSPFLDDNEILRVGGRLRNSNLAFDNKHQMILPKSHKLTKLIFEYFHKKYFHIGPQGLLHYVRMQYWPVSGKNLARKVVHDCIVCFRNNPVTANQIMGDLPPERVTPNFTFYHTGADFCGPFEIKYKNQRKGIFQKIYVAIFVCLVTKAMHLELVTDLTSDAFIAALKRFVSRRGKCSSIITDNATNFKGAKSELSKLHDLVRRPDEKLANYLASEAIEWKFIPPRSPNFGGLWEAGVKSFKYYLKRTLKGARLTIEEFQTITTQIEGILNSRPLTPLSTDINDFDALTPGHFLIGRPIDAIPEPQLIDISESRLSRWQRVTKFVQLIWKNWQLNYLSHLQNRTKWQKKGDNIKPGAMVIIKEDNLPPCKWMLGRILEVIPGKDGNVRVAKIKTASNVFLRSVSKLCILPIDNI